MTGNFHPDLQMSWKRPDSRRTPEANHSYQHMAMASLIWSAWDKTGRGIGLYF